MDNLTFTQIIIKHYYNNICKNMYLLKYQISNNNNKYFYSLFLIKFRIKRHCLIQKKRKEYYQKVKMGG